MIDAKGHELLVGGNPDSGAQSLARAREEELVDKVLERLKAMNH